MLIADEKNNFFQLFFLLVKSLMPEIIQNKVKETMTKIGKDRNGSFPYDGEKNMNIKKLKFDVH